MKFVIALQFYNGDRDRAMRLARMIADIQPYFRMDLLFLFVCRYDCDMSIADLAYVGKKMMVEFFKTTTRWDGWPAGPNGMARDLLEESYLRVKSGRWSDVMGMIMIEPDCIPCDQEWIDTLCSAFPIGGPRIMGAWRPSGGEHGHINGNCVIQADIARLPGFLAAFNQHLAWDCAIVPFVKDYWLETHLIKNCFESTGATREVFEAKAQEPPVLIHGYKDDSCYELARKRLKL
jgi:hypothetical protein